MDNQKVLLRIVQTWDLSPNPEYRGFRCANCQKSIRKAWYHWLVGGGYKIPVHFCSKCEKTFILNKIKINKPIIKVEKEKFLEFSGKIQAFLGKIVDGWSIKTKPIYKIFTCDYCSKNLYRAFHIWNTKKGIFVETHLCRQCKDRIT